MSHFTVLVIGENPEEQLQPYHEYECTGIEDQYVIDVDKTEEVTEWLNKQVFVGKDKDGEYDYQYSAESAAQNFGDFKEMTRAEYFKLIGADVDNEVKEYHGYEKKDGKWTRFTNPNKKWDWYTLGGRWTGFFKIKDNAFGEKIGEPGIFTSPAKHGYVDAARKHAIDFEFMRDDKAKKAAKEYDLAMDIIKDTPKHETWETIRERIENVDDARKAYWEQPRLQAWRNDKRVFDELGYNSSPDDFMISREDFIQNARNMAISTFAVIKDGNWYEKGEMGWWGIVHNGKEQQNWNTEFGKLLESVSDDTLLSVYDCHI